MIPETIVLIILTGLTIYFFCPNQIDWYEVFSRLTLVVGVIVWLVGVYYVIYVAHHFIVKYW